MVEISVIVPVYNVEKYLGECLDSVLGQSFDDFEVVCINDGATDSSLEILNEYASRDERIRIISQENRGLGASRNVGIENSIGKYLFLLDSDDFIHPNTLELLYNNIVANSSDMAIYKLYGYDNETHETKKSKAFNLETVFGDKDFSDFTFTYKQVKDYVLTNLCSTCLKLYDKRFIDKHDCFRFPEGISFEDIPFHVKTMLLASKMSFVPEYLYYYRVNPLSITHDPTKRFDIFQIIDMVESFLEENGYIDEFKEEFKAYKVNRIFSYLISTRSEKFFQKAKEEFSGIDIGENSLLDDFSFENYTLVLDSPSYLDFIFNFYDNKIKRYSKNNKNLSDKNKELIKKNKALSKDMKNLEKKNAKLNNKITILSDKNRKLDDLNNEILSSTSWKVTKPMRDISNKLRK